MCAAVAQKGVWGVAPSGVRAAAPLSPGKDAGRVCPNALCKDAYKWSNKVGAGRTDNKRLRLHRCRAFGHTQPFTVGKGFGDRDREFNISFVKQPISVNRLQSDVIIVHQNLTLTLLNLTLTQFFTLQRLQIDSQCCIIVKV